MRFRSRVLALLSSLATGVAMIALATPSAQALDLPPDKGAINGTITDSVTHAPVAQFCIQGPRSGDPMAYAYACSDSTGYYETMALTPGTYTIEAWHEKLGALTQSVTVGAKESKDITFAFTVPADEVQRVDGGADAGRHRLGRGARVHHHRLGHHPQHPFHR